MKINEQQTFNDFLRKQKQHLNIKIKILNETPHFLQKISKQQFIIFDVAKYFNINLTLSRQLVALWKKFGFIETVPNSRLPKSYKIIKVPDFENIQLNETQ